MRNNAVDVYNLIRSNFPIPMRRLFTIHPPKDAVPHPGKAPLMKWSDKIVCTPGSLEEAIIKLNNTKNEPTEYYVDNICVEYIPYNPGGLRYDRWEGCHWSAPETPQQFIVRYDCNLRNPIPIKREYENKLKSHNDSLESRRKRIEENKALESDNRKIIEDFSSQFTTIWRAGCKAVGTGDTSVLISAIAEWRKQNLSLEINEG